MRRLRLSKCLFFRVLSYLFCSFSRRPEIRMRPLHKTISSQLALSSFELLNLKPPIFEEEGTSNEEVGLRNGPIYRCMGA